MNEQKRRGRPPKRVDLTAAEQIGAMQAEVVNVWAENAAQAYALRIWQGQSPDLSRHERLGRIADALEAQGMSMEGVDL